MAAPLARAITSSASKHAAQVDEAVNKGVARVARSGSKAATFTPTVMGRNPRHVHPESEGERADQPNLQPHR
jgi:hypothetical protein